jgi:hypothetical protein
VRSRSASAGWPWWWCWLWGPNRAPLLVVVGVRQMGPGPRHRQRADDPGGGRIGDVSEEHVVERVAVALDDGLAVDHQQVAAGKGERGVAAQAAAQVADVDPADHPRAGRIGDVHHHRPHPAVAEVRHLAGDVGGTVEVERELGRLAPGLVLPGPAPAGHLGGAGRVLQVEDGEDQAPVPGRAGRQVRVAAAGVEVAVGAGAAGPVVGEEPGPGGVVADVPDQDPLLVGGVGVDRGQDRVRLLQRAQH